MIEDLQENVKIEFLGQVLYAGSSGLLYILLARWLSPQGYGELFLAISVFSVVQMFGDLGVSKSTSRFLTMYRQRDPSQVPHIINYSRIFVIIASILISILLYFASGDIVELLNARSVEPLIIFGPLFILTATLSNYHRIVLQGFEKIKQASAVNGVLGSSRLLCAIILVISGFGVVGALFGYILGFGIAAVLGIVFVRKYTAGYDAAPTIEPGLVRNLLEYSVPLTITKGANLLDKRVDTLLVGYFINPAAVGFYMVGRQVQHFVGMPATALGFTISPTFGSLTEDGEENSSKELYQEAVMAISLIYIPAAVGLIIIADPLTTTVFGQSYTKAVPIIQIFAIYTIFVALNAITSDALDFIGRAKRRATVQTTMSISNFFLNLLLIPTYGVAGAAWATLATFSIYTIVNIYIIHGEFDLDLGVLGIYLLKVVGISLIMVAALIPVQGMLKGVPAVILTILLGVLVWLGASKFVGLFRPTHRQLFESII